MAPTSPQNWNHSHFLFVFGPHDTYLYCDEYMIRSSLAVSKSLQQDIDDSKTVEFVVPPPLPDTPQPTSPLVSRTSSSQEFAPSSNSPTNGHTSPPPYASVVPPPPARTRTGSATSKPVEFYMSLLKKPKALLTTPSEPFYPELLTWLGKSWFANRGSDKTSRVHVATDGQGGLWARSDIRGTFCTNLTLEILQVLKPGPHGTVCHLALGVQGSYVAVFTDGHFQWDLKRCYDRLDCELETRPSGELVYASLSMYDRDRFFCIFRDQTVLYQLPRAFDGLTRAFLDSSCVLKVILASDTAKHSRPSNQQAKTLLPRGADDGGFSHSARPLGSWQAGSIAAMSAGGAAAFGGGAP